MILRVKPRVRQGPNSKDPYDTAWRVNGEIYLGQAGWTPTNALSHDRHFAVTSSAIRGFGKEFGSAGGLIATGRPWRQNPCVHPFFRIRMLITICHLPL